MRRTIVMLLSSFTLALAACGGPAAQTPPADPAAAAPTDAPAGAAADAQPTRGAADDECKDKQPTGDPPTCPAGCIYDPASSKCKSDRGVIVDE